MEQRAVGIDFECPGGVLSKNGFAQLGATIHDPVTNVKLYEFKMYANFIADGYDWDQECVERHWEKHPALYRKTQKECAASTASCREVVRMFIEWVKLSTWGHNAYLASDNCGYDIAILRYFADEDVGYLFTDEHGKPTYKAIQDISSIYRGIAIKGLGRFLLDSTSDYSSKESAMEALGLREIVPPCSAEHDHDPVNDSHRMMHDFCFIMNAANRLP